MQTATDRQTLPGLDEVTPVSAETAGSIEAAEVPDAPERAAGPRWLAWVAVGLAAATVAAVVGAVVISLLPRPAGLAESYGFEDPTGYMLSVGGYGVVQALTAVVVVWLRPRHAVGWLLMTGAVLLNAGTLAEAYAGYGVLVASPDWPAARFGGLLSALWMPSSALPVTLVPLLYPNGRIRSPWRRRLAVASAGSLALLVLATNLMPSAYEDVIPGGEPPLRLPSWLYLPPLVAAGAVFVVSLVAIWVHTAVRLARAVGAERAQLAWLVAAVVPVFGGTFFLSRPGIALLSCLLPVALAVGVFRHNLFGIQVVLRRALVYAVLTAAVSGTYLAVTAAAGAGLGGGGLPGVLAAGLVAVGLTPARNWLQHVVDRFVYGDRRDPMQAVTRLGDSVAATDEPELLRAVVEGVRSAVRAPAAAVLDGSGQLLAGSAALAVPGAGSSVRLPLRVGGGEVGALVVAYRTPREDYRGTDLDLLAALASQVAVVVRTLTLADDLAAARLRIIDAARQERGRYRHDLHDGLGPSLAGIRLSLQVAAGALAAGDQATVARMLDAVRDEAARLVTEIRRIIDDLRPGALDEAGLVEALRRHAATLTARLPVTVEVVEELPRLPAEVENAAYLIAVEALTNVVRHAGASAATVRLTVDAGAGTLVLAVQDDGRGMTGAPRPGGVGIESMTQRATTVRGTLTFTDAQPGTIMTATLPLTGQPRRTA